MAFADHRFSPDLAEVERPTVVHHALQEQVERYHLDEGSGEEDTAELAAKRVETVRVIAKPKCYRVRTKSKSERLLTGCRE